MKHIVFPMIACLLFSTTAALAGTREEERNRAAAIAYYNTQNNGGDWASARTFLADNFADRHPNAPPGAGIEYAAVYYRVLADTKTHLSIVIRSFAEGDLIALQVHDFYEPGTKGTSLMAFFRFDKNGKITDRWQTAQPVPGVLNYNGMF